MSEASRKAMMDKVSNASMPTGSPCCGNPWGCTMTHKGCLHLAHPWKQAIVFGNTDVRCQAAGRMPHPETGLEVNSQCALNAGHKGRHRPVPLGVDSDPLRSNYPERRAER